MDEKKVRSLKDVEDLLGSTPEENRTASAPGIAPARFRLFCDILRKLAGMDSLKEILEQVLDDAIIGALYLDHRYQIGVFSEEDMLLTEAFAAQSALAIQKGRMLEDLRRSHGNLEAKIGEQEKRIARLSEISKVPTRGALR